MGRPKGSKNKKTLLAEQQSAQPAETKEELKVSTVVFSNYLDSIHWHDKDGNTPPELEAALVQARDEAIPHREAIKPLCDLLVSHLETVIGAESIRQAYFIRHLQDIELTSKDGEVVERTKSPHLHMVISVQQQGSYSKNVTRQPLNKWAEGLYCRQNIVNKLNKGQLDNAMSYLIHIKDSEKIQYEPQDVYTARGIDYVEIWNDRKEQWHKGRITKRKNKVVTPEAVDELVDMILSNAITKRELSLNPDYNLIRVYNKKVIDDAFKVATENKSAQAYTEMQEGKFRKSIFYLTGEAGSFKTECSKRLIKRIIAWAKQEFDQNWSYYESAEKNPLDDYHGEEIVWLDDVKQDSFTLGGWLKLLDPNNSSNAAARFSNKPDFTPRVIIFTSTQDPFTFFNYIKNRTNENLEQFYRRITKVVDFSNINPIHDQDTLPLEQSIYCNIYDKCQYSTPRKIYLDTEEDVKARIKASNPDYNPFMNFKAQRRYVLTSIGFEREKRYPFNLHPTAVCDLLVEEVAKRHGRDYSYSSEATDSVKQSVWEFAVEEKLGLFPQVVSNPF